MSLRESALRQPQASRAVCKQRDWLDVNHLKDKMDFAGEQRKLSVTPQLALSCDVRDVEVSCVKSYQDFS